MITIELYKALTTFPWKAVHGWGQCRGCLKELLAFGSHIPVIATVLAMPNIPAEVRCTHSISYISPMWILELHLTCLGTSNQIEGSFLDDQLTQSVEFVSPISPHNKPWQAP